MEEQQYNYLTHQNLIGDFIHGKNKQKLNFLKFLKDQKDTLFMIYHSIHIYPQLL